MPPPNKPADEGFVPFELVPGITLPTWKGINKQGSPAFPQDFELREGQNIRPSGEGYTERGGQAKETIVAVGSIEGIFEFTDVGAPVAPIIVNLPPGQGPLGIALHWYHGGSVVQEERVYNLAYDICGVDWLGHPAGNLAARVGILLHWDGGLYTWGGPNFVGGNWVCYIVRLSAYTAPILSSGDCTATLVASITVPANEFPACGIDSKDAGEILVGLGVVASGADRDMEIHRWDGVSLALDLAVNIPAGAGVNFLPFITNANGVFYMFMWTIHFDYRPGVQALGYMRTAPGAWTPLSFPSQFLSDDGTGPPPIYDGFSATSSAYLDGVLYVGGVGRNHLVDTYAQGYILSVTGSTAEVAHRILESGGIGHITDMHAFNGFIYYGFSTIGEYVLGRYSPSSGWDDTHHLWGAAGAATVESITSYDGSLYVQVNRRLYKSNGTDTTSWVDLGLYVAIPTGGGGPPKTATWA